MNDGKHNMQMVEKFVKRLGVPRTMRLVIGLSKYFVDVSLDVECEGSTHEMGKL